MGDDVYEPFEINDFDLDNAFNPLKRRRGTKNQQIYGVFADEDDEDNDDDDIGRRGRKKKDYSAPMSFVSGGVKKGDKVEPSIDNAQEKEDDDDGPVEISFQNKRQKPFARKSQKFDDTTSFAGIRSSAAAAGGSSSSAHGSWEKHTRGIGAKLLSKMGYVAGKGLGKSGQGIVEPIQAALRPGRGAIGAYGAEVTGPKKNQNEQLKAKSRGDWTAGFDSGEESETEKRGSRWRKDAASKPAKAKLRYKTWEEVVADGGALTKQLAGEHSSVKVIDMTGKEKKVFTGYEVFRYKTKEPESEDEDVDATEIPGRTRAFDLPELRHNLDLLVDMTEEAIVQNDRQLKYLKDQKVALLHDEKQLTETMEMEEKQMNRLNSVLTLLNDFGEMGDARLSLDECKELFKRLQRDYYEEYKMYGLSSIAFTNVLPLLKKYFARWKPLVDPGYGYDEMDEWKSIFDEDSSNYISAIGGCGTKLENMHPYHRLLWDAWMPLVRRCALEWYPKSQCDEMVNLLNHWSPILPGWILENILERIILPRLQREVESWNPMTDTTPIHFWLHPWLPFMGDRLQPIYAPIRHKLGRALVQWHPSDPSAKNVLKPWKEVFAFGAMQSFLSQHILPKLESSLAELQVNPSNQDLRPWHWLMDWLDMINPALVADILVRQFFPKWHHTLRTWLNCRTANYNEITQWYSGWKSLIHSDLMAFHLVRDQFTHALEIMNQAISGGGLQPSVPYSVQPRIGEQSAAERQRLAAEAHQRHMDILASRSGGAAAPVNFKDLVERKAEENGLLFMPIPNKFREGKPVCRFGSCQIYLDRNVVFLLQPSSNLWIPVSLEQLVTSASS